MPITSMKYSEPAPTTVLATVNRLGPPGTPMSTTEVAAEFDCPLEAVDDRLRTLVKDDFLDRKIVGNQQVWWRPPRDTQQSHSTPTSNDVDADSASQPLSMAELNPVLEVLDTVGVGIFILDSTFEVVWFNTAIEQYFGLDRQAIIGRNKRNVIREEIRGTVANPDRFAETVLTTYNDNTFSEQFECRITASDGRGERWLEHRSAPIKSGVYEEGRIELYDDITDRKRHEQALRHQHEQLAELNSINKVIQNITTAVIEQSTRGEIETIVCDRLTDVDNYEFAWIGEVDTQSQAIRPRAEGGVEGYLEDVSLSANPNNPGGHGPAGTAIRTQEMQVTQDVLSNPEFEPWHEYAEHYGYRSVAVVPIVYAGSCYGLLGIYAANPHAFDNEVCPVVAQLGEIMGHAIAATERKQALMSPEITEIQFLVPDLLSDMSIDSDHDGTITLDRVVPLGDDVFLEYGTVDTDVVETLEAIVGKHPHLELVTLSEQDDETLSFVIKLLEPPITSVIATYGGYLQQMNIKDGSLQMTIHLPTTVPARRIIDRIQQQYPTVELLSRRQRSRSTESPERVELTSDLTDRQRAVIETSVRSGYFEWPRNVSGEELATLFGVTPPTFHQHLRLGQKKIFESLFLLPPFDGDGR